MHETVQFLAFQSLFSWDNFTATSPITNNMVDLNYDFSLVINAINIWIYTGVIRQRSSYYYIIWVSGWCSRFLVLLNWNKSASEIHLNDFTCYPIHIQYASQYRIPVSRFGFAMQYSPLIGLGISKEKMFENAESEWSWTKINEWPWPLIFI